MQKRVIVLLGPTGIGKTDLGIEIARAFSAEIISCDSRQFYSGMSVGTAIPSSEQLRSVKHHFIQHLQPDQYYSSSLFERDVLALLPGLFEKHDNVLMVGGSGLYIDAVCDGTDDIPDVDPSVREKYLRKYAEEGIESLRSELRILDPEHYRRVDLRNYKRILRALEICGSTGRPYSSFLTRVKREREFGIVKIGLRTDRDILYDRINRRVDGMISNGLEEEARRLLEYRHCNALNTLGYREMFEYFDGRHTLEEAVELIKRNSRRFAKRQITWWARDSSIKWFEAGQNARVLKYIDSISR